MFLEDTGGILVIKLNTVTKMEIKEDIMAIAKLGVMKEFDIRSLWNHEQYDFSEWLSQEENLQLLNNAIGLSISEVEKEVYVGAYRCDIVGIDEDTRDRIIIENQLEQSNHEHLGKIITYASGLDASIIVWIVKDAREEHRSAVEWLNNNTGKKINFFLIEIHAYKIDDSLPSPMFEVVEKPNDFIKNVKGQTGTSECNRLHSERLDFWTRFNEILIEKGKPFNVRKASTEYIYHIAIGDSGAYVSFNLDNKDGYVVLEFHIKNNKQLFNQLELSKSEIEDDLNLKLDWQRLDNRKVSKIMYKIPGLNFDDHSNYDSLMAEMIDKGVLFVNVFKKYIK